MFSNNFPEDLVSRTTLSLNPESILNLMRINKRIYNILSNNEILWEIKNSLHFSCWPLKKNGPHNFGENYIRAYESIPAHLRILFSYMKEGDVEGLTNHIATLTYIRKIGNKDNTLKELENTLQLKDFLRLDQSTMFFTFAATNNQRLLDEIYKLAVDEFQSNKYVEDDEIGTLLHWAIMCNQPLSIIKSLIHHNTNIHTHVTPHKRSALHLACHIGRADIAQLLLEKKPEFINQISANKATALHYAAHGGYIDIVKLLLKTDPTLINQVEISGETAINYAAFNGHLDIVKLLLEIEPTLINQVGKFKQTVLHSAVRKNNLDIVKFLVEKEPTLIAKRTASPSHKKIGYMPIHTAIEKGYMDIVNFLLGKNWMLINKRRYFKNRLPIHIAAQHGHLNITQLLLRHSSKHLNALDFDNKTPVYLAASHGHADIVKYLANKKADLSITTKKNGYAPLHIGTDKGDTEIVKTLLECGAKINQIIDDDYTITMNDVDINTQAIHIACRNGYFDIVRLLIKNRNDLINAASDDRGIETPLYHAVCTKEVNLHLVNYLVNNSADENVKRINAMNKYHAFKCPNELALFMYLRTINHKLKNQPSEKLNHKKPVVVLGHTLKFHFTLEQKKKAAQALKAVVLEEKDLSSLSEHKIVLENNKKLKSISENLLSKKKY